MPYVTRDMMVRILGDASGFKSAAKEVSGESKKTTSSLETFASGAKKTAIVLGGIGVGLTAFAKSATDYTVNLVKESKTLSRQTGMNIEDSSRLLYATQRFGLSAEQATQMFGFLSKQISETAKATNPAATALGRLGVQVLDNNGKVRSFNDILLETADKFAGMKDGSQKTALAMQLFGRSGKDMLPILNLGSKGIKELQKKADELGLTLNSKTVAAVYKYIQSTKDLKDSTNALKVQVGTLTAPVLANFNNKLNSVVSSLTQTEGPMRTMVANTLAFGGPVASAGAGLAAFAANIATTVSALGGFGKAFAALRAFIMGPWGIAIALGITAIGALTAFLGRHKTKTDETKTSTQNLTTAEDELSTQMQELAASTDRATQVTNALKDAQLDAEGAALGVERATRNYNEAVKANGRRSLEAREASHALKEAKMRLKDANDKVKLAQQNQTWAEGKFIQQTGAAQRGIRIRVSAFAGIVGTLKDADYRLRVLDARISKRVPVLQGSVVNLQGSVIRLQGSVKNLQGSVGKLQGGSVNLQGGRAAGGPVKAGSSYLVGEEGMEIFTPKQDGYIIPNHEIKSASEGSSKTLGGGGITNHIEFAPRVQIGMFAGMPAEYREIAERLWVEFTRIAKSNGIKLQNIGARVQ